MFYKGRNMNLEEYLNTQMAEMGFSEGVVVVDGYYRSEAEYNAIADYKCSCDLTVEDEAFMQSLGYVQQDFEVD